jgi:hypothetical protein
MRYACCTVFLDLLDDPHASPALSGFSGSGWHTAAVPDPRRSVRSMPSTAACLSHSRLDSLLRLAFSDCVAHAASPVSGLHCAECAATSSTKGQRSFTWYDRRFCCGLRACLRCCLVRAFIHSCCCTKPAAPCLLRLASAPCLTRPRVPRCVIGQIGFLYEPFKTDSWWFELVDIVHKLLLVSHPSPTTTPAHPCTACLVLLLPAPCAVIVLILFCCSDFDRAVPAERSDAAVRARVCDALLPVPAHQEPL